MYTVYHFDRLGYSRCHRNQKRDCPPDINNLDRPGRIGDQGLPWYNEYTFNAIRKYHEHPPPLGDAPIGQQLLAHYARRDAVRHATPLFPSSWAEYWPRSAMRVTAQAQARLRQEGRRQHAVGQAG